MSAVGRRTVMVSGLAAAAAGGAATAASPASARGHGAGFDPPLGPRFRIVSDNDYAGDPDGLFQLAHHLLSPSVDVRAVVASHLAPGDPFDPSDQTATNGAAKAREVVRLARRGRSVRVLAGSNVGLASRDAPRPSAGVRALVTEAMRDDTDLPLFVTLGAGLTELASAWLTEPAIADRLTAVWIGGPEYPSLGVPAPPGAAAVEYNLNIDLLAAQVVFEDSTIPIWQVPRSTYRTALVSMTELARRVRPAGRLGRHLDDALRAVHELAGDAGLNMGETYILGDNPLVLLTALQSSFEADPSSSEYATVPAPRIGDDGSYTETDDGRPIRVWTRLDNRLMFEDLYAKLAPF